MLKGRPPKWNLERKVGYWGHGRRGVFLSLPIVQDVDDVVVLCCLVALLPKVACDVSSLAARMLGCGFDRNMLVFKSYRSVLQRLSGRWRGIFRD